MLQLFSGFALFIGEMITLGVVLLIWLASAWPRMVLGPRWCESFRFDGRDLTFMIATGALFLLSFVWWYAISSDGLQDNCTGLGHVDITGTADPAIEARAEAVCMAAERGTTHLNAWHQDITWLPILFMMIVCLIIVARVRLHLPPIIARVTTRVIMVVVDLLVVLQVFARPEYQFSRTWAIWAGAFCVATASSAVIRGNARGGPFYVRWLID